MLQQRLGARPPLTDALTPVRPVLLPCLAHFPSFADAKVNALVAPHPESIARVLALLKAHGVDVTRHVKASPNSDFITATMTVAAAEEMLGTTYHTYNHRQSGVNALRMTGDYTLPAEVAQHVDFVGPSVRFPTIQTLRVGSAQDGGFDDDGGGGVTPKMLRKLYSVGDAKGSASGNLQAVNQFLGQYYAPSDLATFFQQYDPQSEGRTVNKVVGPNDAGNPGVEATLDIQYNMAMGANIKTDFYSTAGQQPHNPQNEPFLTWLQNLASMSDADVAKTISTSYGDNEDGVWLDYAQRVNTEFMKAGARGISLFFSSGDGGVAGGQPTSCTTFIPTFPAASPWVTAVGGTTGSGPETAAGLSSGGFSNYWARPSYQKSAVEGYLSSAPNLPEKNRFNQTGAGFPDIAAQAEDYMIVYGGSGTPVSGTSCSSPTVTGIFSLVNDARLAAGKKPLGYLNQLIYKNADVFNDITSGNNPGCGTNGFSATTGWVRCGEIPALAPPLPFLHA